MGTGHKHVDVQIDVPRHPTAPSMARLRVRRIEGFPERSLPTVELLLTELVTNALLHSYGNGAIEVRVFADRDRIRLEVDDGGTSRLEATEISLPDRSDLGGRGLFLVQEMSSRWGVAGPRNNIVWCELDLH